MSKLAEKVRLFFELVKFEHSVFALPYAYIGALYALAPKWPTLAQMLWITVAMVGARSFAFVVNRVADRRIDARNPRTAGRAVPAGRIGAAELVVIAALVLAAFLAAVWQLAPLTHRLWPIVLAAFLVYPYTKRFTPLCHYWLGMCLGLAPVGAWVAVGAPITAPTPWLFGLAVTLWTAGFDIIYATQDVACDVRDGVHSMPADLGIARALVQTRVTHVLTIVLLLAGGVLVGAGWPWYAGVAVAAGMLWYENSIVRADDLSRLNAAFFTMNGLIAITVFAGALLDRLIG